MQYVTAGRLDKPCLYPPAQCTGTAWLHDMKSGYRVPSGGLAGRLASMRDTRRFFVVNDSLYARPTRRTRRLP